MKIIIAGYGFVGKAVANALQSQHEVIIQDPKYTDYKMMDHRDADGIIICVNTPDLPNGGCDCSEICNVLDDVPIFIPVLIKSTVTPTVVNALAEMYPDHCITYNPEFLRANTANADFPNQKFMVLGEDPDCFWQDLFTTVLKSCRIYFNCSAIESAMVKYSINAFLATKVAFFNNIYEMCKENGADFDVVRQLITQDSRIGSSHTLVPGADGEYGFGGHCFPKDTAALIHYADSLGIGFDIVKSAVEYNKKVRK